VVQTTTESAADVVSLVQQQFDALAAAPVPEAELAARKATLIGNFSRSVETTAGLAGAVKALVVAGLAPAELRRRIAALSAVSAEDVQRYAAAHLRPAGRRVVVAGEAARFEQALRAAAPGLRVIPAARLDVESPGGLRAR
jgi:zinc protease